MWRRYLRFWGPDVRADVDDELRFHLEARAEELRALGHAPAEAERLALEAFGDVEGTRRGLEAIGARLERRRERARWLRRLGADLAYAARGLRDAPLFTAGVVLTLTLGLGAAATMYGTMRRLLLDPPPHVAAPDGLALVHFRYRAPEDTADARNDRFSYPFLERLHAEARTLVGAAAYQEDEEIVLGEGAGARLARATFVSPGFWPTLGARPLLGRVHADGETHPVTGNRTVVLGHAFWRAHLGGDPDVVGRTLRVKGLPYRVIGVLPRGFRGVARADTDVWLPFFTVADGTGRPARWHTFASSSNLHFVVRPRVDVPRARVLGELTRLHGAVADEAWGPLASMGRPAPRTGVALVALTGAVGPEGVRIPEATVTLWLVGVAGVLLVVACANVASLLLLRALRRRREIAVRLALGMSRRRLAGMLLVESGLLAVLGGLGALAAALAGGAWLRRTLLPGMLGEDTGIDGRMLAVFAGAVLATAALTGLAPVLQTRRGAKGALRGDALRDGAQHGATRRSRLYHGLLVAQTALSALLLVGAGLFLHSLHRIGSLDLGLDTRHVHIATADFTGTGRTPAQAAAVFERALARARALPGVVAASVATGVPLRGAQGMSFSTTPGGAMIQTDQGVPMGYFAGDGYLAATGMRVVQGRDFVASDRTGGPAVIVNEALARVAWPGRSPVGACAYLPHPPETRPVCARVVGVAGDARTFRLVEEQQRLVVLVALPPTDTDARLLLVRTAPGAEGGDQALTRALRGVLREQDAALPYVDVRRLGDALDPQIRPWRMGAAVFTAFGALAMTLAALGLYTAVAYAVTQRTREIGVRLALGALGRQVVGLVLRDGLRVAGVGVGTGLLAAALAGRWLAALLFDTSPREPVVFAAVAGVLVAVAVVACVGPARRATRLDPTAPLRAE